MNRLALDYLDDALRLDAENRELRRMLTALLWRLAERDELLEYAAEQIEWRWPAEGKRAA